MYLFIHILFWVNISNTYIHVMPSDAYYTAILVKFQYNPEVYCFVSDWKKCWGVKKHVTKQQMNAELTGPLCLNYACAVHVLPIIILYILCSDCLQIMCSAKNLYYSKNYVWITNVGPTTICAICTIIHSNDYTYDYTYIEVWRFAVIHSKNWTPARWVFQSVAWPCVGLRHQKRWSVFNQEITVCCVVTCV